MTSDNTNAWSKISPTSPDAKSSQVHKRRRDGVQDNDFERDSVGAEVPEQDELLDEFDEQEDGEEENMVYSHTRKRFCRRPSAFDGICLPDDEEEAGEDMTTQLEAQVAQLRDTVHVMEQQVAWAVERMTALQGLVDLYEQERQRSIVKS
ncbi:hypothetical protein PINS_up015970 [Pythium insidiosum]|nr:hypothetical protein PINS_up015970 [Pythium insidiosum]